MAIITLTTDYGRRDPYAAMVRGAILSQDAQATVIDISHDIDPFDIAQCAYVIASSYKSFPDGTIHIIGVDAERTDLQDHVAMKYDQHYFICADNGVLSLLLRDLQPEELVTINIHQYISRNFPVLDIFVNVACLLARGGLLTTIGRARPGLKKLESLEPRVTDNRITGRVIYTDNYGNAISNVSRQLIKDALGSADLTIRVGPVTIKKIVERYSGIVNWEQSEIDMVMYEGKAFAIYNAMDLIEIGVYRGNRITGVATTLLGLEVNTEFVIERTREY